MIVRVYDGGDARSPGTDVPLTPDTTCEDLIECCRDPGDDDCELVGIWASGNCECALRGSDRPLEILQRWGSGSQDSVKLMLRYTPLQEISTSSSSTSSSITINRNVERGRAESRNGMKEPGHFEETLPDGVQLTLGELREMAYRQQHQIESQHQLLAAKEQRLRFLKDQEARQQRVASENERLRRLRDRVEAQELKLRKLRALRGQVDQTKQNNALLTSDLDSIRALFNEKEKELSVAVAKVDELTRQLEDLRRGRATEPPSTAALELEKLRRELMYRNKLNEQQNVRLYQQREALTQRQEEMTSIDKRISELQDRLNRKRILNQQLAKQITNVSNKVPHPLQLSSPSILPHQTNNNNNNNNNIINNNFQSGMKKQQSRGNIAAIEPYNRIPVGPNEFSDKLQRSYFIPVIANQLKNIADQNDVTNYKNHKENYGEIMNSIKKNNTNQQLQQQQLQQLQQQQQQLQQRQQQLMQMQQQQYAKPENEVISEFGGSKSDPKYQTLPYNTKFSVNFLSKNNRDVTESNDKTKFVGVNEPEISHSNNNVKSYQMQMQQQLHQQQHQLQQLQQHMTVHSTPLSTINKALAVPLDPNSDAEKSQNNQKIYDQQPSPSGGGPIDQTNRLHVQVSRGQPVGGPSSTNSSTSPTSQSSSSQPKPTNYVTPTSVHQNGNKLSTIYQTSSTKIQPVQPQMIQTTSATFSNIPAVSTTMATPPLLQNLQMQQQQFRQQQQFHQQQMQQIQQQLQHSENFLNLENSNSNSGIVNDKSPKPVLPPKPLIKPPPRQMQQSGELEGTKSGKESTLNVGEIQENSGVVNNALSKSVFDNKPIKAKPLTMKKQPHGEQPRLRTVPKLNGVHVSINRRIEMPPAFLFPETESPPSDLINSNVESTKKILKNQRNEQSNKSQDVVDKVEPQFEQITESHHDEKTSPMAENENFVSSNNNNADGVVIRRATKGNLKQTGKVNLSRRVSFDPLALLLDASLEGELELVKKTATQVTNPSAANDEGITALHNAICAGHLEIVQFLVEFGCDVNAQDSDGWTPLHCAASCNNVAMVRFLVEHGACIFATTLSDHETAAEKCEEDEEGFDGCSEYLYSVQEKLGILCGGVVYAVFDYVAQQPDELSFEAGAQITVLRKGDENEREWWWARLGDHEGYVPRNLLGLYPRVLSKSD